MAAKVQHGLGVTARRIAGSAIRAVSPPLLRRLQRARAQTLYRREPVAGPKRLLLEPTTACNYRCLMCTDHSSLLDFHTAAKAMPWEQVEKLLRDAAAMGTEELWLAGRGEPLLHPQVTEIVALAASLGLYTMITSNAGLLTESLADKLCDVGLGAINMSINSGCPETYAHVHGARAAERERVLSLMRRLANRPRPPWLCASMVLLKPNYGELLDFVKDAIAAGTKAVNLLGLRHIPLFPTLAMDEDDWEKARRDVGQASALARQAGVEFLSNGIPPSPGAAPQADRSHWTLGCFVGHLFTRIDVDGSLHGCCSCGNYLGSLADGSLADQWHGPSYRRFRSVCRGMAVTQLAPPQCSCGDCGNVQDNVVAHAALGFRAIGGQEEGPFATRLDLARVIWQHLGDQLPRKASAPGFCDLTPAQAGPSWEAAAGLQAAGVMVGIPSPGGLPEFRPRQLAGFTESGEVLRRALALLGVEEDSGKQLLTSGVPRLRGQDAVLQQELEHWARAVRGGLPQTQLARR